MPCLSAHYHSFLLSLSYMCNRTVSFSPKVLRTKTVDVSESSKNWMSSSPHTYHAGISMYSGELSLIKCENEKCSLLREMRMCCNCNCMFIYIAPFQQNSSEVLSIWLTRDPNRTEWSSTACVMSFCENVHNPFKGITCSIFCTFM